MYPPRSLLNFAHISSPNPSAKLITQEPYLHGQVKWPANLVKLAQIPNSPDHSTRGWMLCSKTVSRSKYNHRPGATRLRKSESNSFIFAHQPLNRSWRISTVVTPLIASIWGESVRQRNWHSGA